MDEVHVCVSVVASGEFDKFLSASESAHDTDDTEAGFSARVDEADHLDGGDGVDDGLGEFVLEETGCAEGCTLLDLLH